MDIKGPITDEKGKICSTFSGNKYALICRDLKSKFRYGFLLQNKGYLLRYIKHLIALCRHKDIVIKILRIDDEFLTEEIKEYLLHETKIELKPCIPHEHATLPYIERDNRTLEDAIVKVIKAKPHLNEKFWGMAFHDILLKWNIFSSEESPDISPYEEWYGFKFNLIDNPIIPFGSIVMAHIPLDQQTTLGDRAVKTYYVGIANGYKGGIQLYNPVTKHCIVRRSYKIIGPVDQADSQILLESKNDMPLLQDEIAIPQFGNDVVMDHDPLDGPYNQHVPIVDNTTTLNDDEFYVERIINHKGRGRTLKFWVK